MNKITKTLILLAIICIISGINSILYVNYFPPTYYISDSINKTAYNIRLLSHEVAYIYSGNMDVLYSTSGSENSIVVPTILLKNTTLLHNHPFERCIFSEQDLKTALESNIYGMYLSSPEGLNISYYPYKEFKQFNWSDINEFTFKT